jgi:hypothetical protein
MTLQPPLQVDAEKQILDLEERRLAMAEILNWDLEDYRQHIRASLEKELF